MYWTFCSEDLNSPRLQPGVVGTPQIWALALSLKIKAWAKARSRGAIPIHALKHVAIQVLQAK